MSQENHTPKRNGWLEDDIADLMRHETAQFDPDQGLDRFMAAVAAHPKSQPIPSLWQRINNRLSMIGLTPALASLVIVFQFAVLVVMSTSEQTGQPATEFRGYSATSEAVPDLKLRVNPDADFAGLASLLNANGCRIVAGPSQQGEIWISVEDKRRIGEVKAILLQSKLIDDVSVKR